jgi:hypothetical protein
VKIDGRGSTISAAVPYGWEHNFIVWLQQQPEARNMLSPRVYRQRYGHLMGWQEQVRRNRELYEQVRACYEATVEPYPQ